jgi:hypothetical protein
LLCLLKHIFSVDALFIAHKTTEEIATSVTECA